MTPAVRMTRTGLQLLDAYYMIYFFVHLTLTDSIIYMLQTPPFHATLHGVFRLI